MVAGELLEIIEKSAPDISFSVSGEGKNFSIEAVGTRFQGMSRLGRQKEVFKLISHLIADGTLHAISINTYTPSEFSVSRPIEDLNR